MKSETFHVPNISCGHCTHAIETELAELAGVSSVKGDIEAKSVVVEYDAPASVTSIRDLLKEINYPAK